MIGFDLTCFTSERSGIARVAMEFAREFQSEQNSILYINLGTRNLIPRIINSRVIGIKKFKFLFALFWLPIWLRQDKIEKMIFFNHRVPFLIPKNISVVIFVHDLVHLKYPTTMKFSTRILDNIFFGRSCKRADKIVCVSRATAQELRSEFPELDGKIAVIHPLIGKTRQLRHKNFWRRELHNNVRFLSVGSFEPRKNYRRLLSAFSLVSRTNTSWSLEIVGSYSWGLDSIEELVSGFGLESQVIVKRDVSEEELGRIFGQVDCLIQPSIYEGFGLPVLEAIRSTLPVLVSKEGAPGEIVGEPLFTFDPLDAQSIAAAIKNFMELSEPEIALERTRMERRSDELSWKDSVYQLKRLISQQ